jgi:hypothetical protein
MLALPNLLAFAAWMARRNHRAAALLLVDAAMEASALLTTDYPPPVLLPWLSFRDHNRIAAVHGACAAGMALVVPNIPARDRGLWRPQRCRSCWACSVARALPTHLNSRHDL